MALWYEGLHDDDDDELITGTILFFSFKFFQARSKNCEKRLLASSCGSVHPSARTLALPLSRIKQLGSHWTDFHEILYFSVSKICRKN